MLNDNKIRTPRTDWVRDTIFWHGIRTWGIYEGKRFKWECNVCNKLPKTTEMGALLRHLKEEKHKENEIMVKLAGWNIDTYGR